MNPVAQNFLSALQRLARSGYRSSEFGLVSVLVATLFLAAYSGRLSPDLAASLATALGIAYKYFRAQVKGQVGSQILLLADTVAADPAGALHATPAEVEHAAAAAFLDATSTPSTPEAAAMPPAPAPSIPPLKLPLLIAALLAGVSIFSGCSSNPATQAKLSATAAYAGSKTLSVIEGAAFSAAGSLLDEAVSGQAVDYTQGLTVGLRSAEGSLLSSGDVRSLVAIWTKQAPALAPLAAQLAQTYAAAHPQTPAQASAALEAIARGLDAATGPVAKQP